MPLCQRISVTLLIAVGSKFYADVDLGVDVHVFTYMVSGFAFHFYISPWFRRIFFGFQVADFMVPSNSLCSAERMLIACYSSICHVYIRLEGLDFRAGYVRDSR